MAESVNKVEEGAAIKDFADRTALIEWSRSLKRMDGRAAARTIYAALKQAKGQRLPVRQLFEFLELLGGPVSDVLGNLHKYYWNVQFPLPARTLAAATMADDLCDMLIMGYQTVLREIHSVAVAPDAAGQFSGLWQTVAHRILHYSGHIVTNRALLNADDRINVWLRVNKIFVTSLKEKLHGQPIAFEGVKDYPASSVEHLYRKLLLVSLVPLHALRRNQMQECLDTLEVWADAVGIKRCSMDRDHSRMPFQIDPTQDRGPYSSGVGCEECTNSKCMALDMGKLQNLLSQTMLQAAQVEQERVCLKNGSFIGVSTLELLKSYWRERPQRSDQRILPLGHAEIEILVTLNEIHHVLGGGEAGKRGQAEAKKPTPATTVPEQERRAATPVFDRVSMESHGFKTAEHPEGTPSEEHHERRRVDPWKETQAGSGYHFHKAILKDRSVHGYGLEIRIQELTRVLVGDLVGVRLDGARPITLGVVRWIRQHDDDSLSCGLLLLGEELHPASLVPEQSGSEIPCLVARHRRNQKTMLVLDYFPLLRNKRFILHLAEKQLPIAFVGWPLEESRAFEAFEFGVRAGEENVPDPDRPLLTIEELVVDAAPPAPAAEDESAERAPVEAEEAEGYDENLWRID